MIRLSVVIPSSDAGLTAYARILQACSWAGPRVEVVVRDTSGDSAKAAFLRGLDHENCRVIVAPPGDARANRRAAIEQAQGDFVYLLADDAVCFDRALTIMPGVLESLAGDPAIVGVAAPALVETQQGWQAYAYPNIDAGDPLVRLSGYLSAQGPNLLVHSPVRRTTLTWALETVAAKPFAFAFDDEIFSLLCLLSGKFARMKRLMYVHDAGRWDFSAAPPAGTTVYASSRLDPAIDRLHWFLCGFQGAALIRNMALQPDYAPAQRQALADLWFSAMFSRFRQYPRSGGASPSSGAAEKLCTRWKESGPRLSSADMLAEICAFLALSSQENALRYSAYWSTILRLPQAPAA